MHRRVRQDSHTTLKKRSGTPLLKPSLWVSAALAVAAGWCWFGGRESPSSGLPSQELSASPAIGPVALNAGDSTGSPDPEAGSPAANAGTLPAVGSISAAWESLQREADTGRLEEKIESLVTGVAETNLEAAAALLLQRTDSPLSRDLGMRLLRRWTDLDPQGVAGWVAEHVEGPARAEAISAVAVVWSEHNLADATGWARQLPEGHDRQAAMTSVAYEAARTDPLEAVRLATELPSGREQEDLIVHAAIQWAAVQGEAAAGWAIQIPNQDLRERLLSGIATSWGESEPAAAATFAVGSLPPGRPLDDAVVGIVQRWVQKDPRQAAAWVSLFPAGPLRETAVYNIAALWPPLVVE